MVNTGSPRVFNTQTYLYMFLMSSGRLLYCGSQNKQSLI
jgi:hypothetical protein